jgi:hypothetical protein
MTRQVFSPTFIFCDVAAILIYKTLGGLPKKTRKLVHLILQAIAGLFALLGIYAAYKYHVASNIDNWYSLHSWLGIATVTSFFLQVHLLSFLSCWPPFHISISNFTETMCFLSLRVGMFDAVARWILLILDSKRGPVDKIRSSAVAHLFGIDSVRPCDCHSDKWVPGEDDFLEY